MTFLLGYNLNIFIYWGEGRVIDFWRGGIKIWWEIFGWWGGGTPTPYPQQGKPC